MAQDDFLKRVIGEAEETQEKTAADTELALTDDQKAISEKAYALIDKLAADLAKDGVTVPKFEELTEQEQDLILARAVEEVSSQVETEKQAELDDATTRAMQDIAISEEFGEFLGYKMHAAETGLVGRTQKLLDKVAGYEDPRPSPKEVALNALKNRNIEKKSSLDEIPMTPEGIQAAAANKEWMGRHTSEVAMATYMALKRRDLFS